MQKLTLSVVACLCATASVAQHVTQVSCSGFEPGFSFELINKNVAFEDYRNGGRQRFQVSGGLKSALGWTEPKYLWLSNPKPIGDNKITANRIAALFTFSECKATGSDGADSKPLPPMQVNLFIFSEEDSSEPYLLTGCCSFVANSVKYGD